MAASKIDENQLAITSASVNTTHIAYRGGGNGDGSTTMSPGHQAILEMHANSQSNAIIYVVVVLTLYVLGMTVVLVKYIRTERYEARLTRLFHDLVQRDRFFRLSRRRSSVPKCTPAPSTVIEDEVSQSPTINLQENGQLEMESKL